jgi:uronate dehydrogenase
MKIVPKNVLVTGAAGAIGRAACCGLTARGHSVRGFDLRMPAEPIEGVEIQLGDLTDEAAVHSAVSGVDAVVHLAACPDEADFKGELLGPNVIGVYHVLEASRIHQVGRVVVTSSGQTIQGHDWRRNLITVDESYSPLTHYAVTKVMAEAWARYYAFQHGMSMIVVRPGAFPRDEEQWTSFENDEGIHRIFLSANDAGRFFSLCIEAEDVDFAVLFATSRPTGPMAFDLEPARRIIGYEPRDSWTGKRS